MLSVIDALFQVFYIILFLWIILSWVRPQYGSWIWDIQQALNNLLDPLLAPIRAVMPPMGGLDLSPIVLLFLLRIFRGIVAASFG